MSIGEKIGKAFSFFLMSMGVSTYGKKPAEQVPAPKVPSKPA